MALLKQIMPTNYRLLNTNRVKEQFKIFADYITPKTPWPYTATARNYYGNLSKWILEILNEENDWTNKIEQAIDEATGKQEATAIYNTNSFEQGIFGKSFTMD